MKKLFSYLIFLFLVSRATIYSVPMIGTMIVAMADYSHKQIEEIVPGDFVKSYDFKKQKIVAAKVLNVEKNLNREDAFVFMQMEDDSNYCFNLDQQLYVPSLWAFVPAKLLTAEMSLMSFPLQFKKIKSIYTQKVCMRFSMYFYELTIENTENFFVTKDHLLVHNNPAAFPLCAAPLIPECTAVALEAIAMTVASPAFLPAVGTIAAGLAVYYSYNAVVSRYSSPSQPQDSIPVSLIYEKSSLQPGEISSFFQAPRAFETQFPVRSSSVNLSLQGNSPVFADSRFNSSCSSYKPTSTLNPPNVYSCETTIFGKDCTLSLQIGPTREQALAMAEMERQERESYAEMRAYESKKRVLHGSAFIKYLDQIEREVRSCYKGFALPSADFTRDINAYRVFCEKLVNHPASLDLDFNIEFSKIEEIVKDIVRQEIGRVHAVLREKYEKELADFIKQSLALQPRGVPSCYNDCLTPSLSLKCYQDTAGSYWIRSPDNNSQNSWFTFSQFGEGLMMSHEPGQFLWIKDSLPVKNYLDVMKGCARTLDKNLPPVDIANNLTISAYKEKETDNTWVNISSDVIWRVYSKNMTKIAEIDHDGSLIWTSERPLDFYGLLRTEELSNLVWDNMPEPKQSVEEKKKEPLKKMPVQDAFLVNAVHLSKAFFEEYFCSFCHLQEIIASDPSLLRYLSNGQDVEKDLLKAYSFKNNDPKKDPKKGSKDPNKDPKGPNWRNQITTFFALIGAIKSSQEVYNHFKNDPALTSYLAFISLIAAVIVSVYAGGLIPPSTLSYYASIILAYKSFFTEKALSLPSAVLSGVSSPAELYQLACNSKHILVELYCHFYSGNWVDVIKTFKLLFKDERLLSVITMTVLLGITFKAIKSNKEDSQDTQLDKALDTINNLQNQNNSLQAQNKALHVQNKGLQVQNNGLQVQNQNLQTKNDKALDTIDNLHSQNDKALDIIRGLQVQNQNLQNESTTFSNQLIFMKNLLEQKNIDDKNFVAEITNFIQKNKDFFSPTTADLFNKEDKEKFFQLVEIFKPFNKLDLSNNDPKILLRVSQKIKDLEPSQICNQVVQEAALKDSSKELIEDLVQDEYDYLRPA